MALVNNKPVHCRQKDSTNHPKSGWSII